jgi:signal peptidase I
MIPVDDVIGRADGIVWPFGHAARLHRPDAYARVPAPGADAAHAAAGAAAHPAEDAHG